MLYIIDLSLRCVLVLLVRCQHYLLCMILSGSFSPLLNSLNLGIIRKQNIWRPDLSDVVLLSSMVILFSSKIWDPDKLFQQLDE